MEAKMSLRLFQHIASELIPSRPLWALAIANEYKDPSQQPLRRAILSRARRVMAQLSPTHTELLLMTKLADGACLHDLNGIDDSAIRSLDQSMQQVGNLRKLLPFKGGVRRYESSRSNPRVFRSSRSCS